MEDRLIKDIYNVTEEPEIDDTLVKWYNKVINKRPSEVSVGDIARMVRQKRFYEVALERGTQELMNDPFAGELFIGELLEKILMLDKTALKSQKKELETIYKTAIKNIDSVAWGYPEEKDEYREVLEKLKALIKELQ